LTTLPASATICLTFTSPDSHLPRTPHLCPPKKCSCLNPQTTLLVALPASPPVIKRRWPIYGSLPSRDNEAELSVPHHPVTKKYSLYHHRSLTPYYSYYENTNREHDSYPRLRILSAQIRQRARIPGLKVRAHKSGGDIASCTESEEEGKMAGQDIPADPAKALECKEKGNKCFQAADFLGAEALYSKAYVSSPIFPHPSQYSPTIPMYRIMLIYILKTGYPTTQPTPSSTQTAPSPS
jgi:hypothetical protein